MIVCLDLEGDNLHPFLTKIFVVCVRDTARGVTKSYRDKETLLRDAEHWRTIIGHNLLGYDLLALYLVWGIPFTVGPDTFNGRDVTFVDTLVYSRYLYPDRPDGHSLESWGKRVGIEKMDHSDFSGYSEQMRQYCERDTEVTHEVYKRLLQEIQRDTQQQAA